LRQIAAHIRALLLPSEQRRWRWLLLLDTGIALADLLSLLLLLFTVHFYTAPAVQLPVALPPWLQNREGIGLMAAVLLFFAIKSALGYWVHRQLHHFAYNVAARLSARHLLYYLEGRYAAYATVDPSVHIKRISQHPVELAHYLLLGLHQWVIQAVLVGLSLGLLLGYRPTLFLLLLVLLAPPVWLAARLVRSGTKKARTQVKAHGEKALQHLQEALAGYVEANLYQRQDFFTDRYATYQQRLNHWLAGLHGVQGLSIRTVELFAVLGLFLLVALALLTRHQAIDFLTIGAFMAAAYKVMPGLVKLLNTAGQMKVYAYTAADLAEAERAVAGQRPAPAAEPLRSLTFHNVHFGHAGQPLLQGCSFALQPCDFVGLQTGSGSGKTTLLRLLLGFETQEAGEILYNNLATTADQRAAWWPQVAYVQQQPFLLHDTLRANIILGNGPADEARLQQAVTDSGLRPLVDSLPQGLDTLVAPNGHTVSGGQRQRIALARALYKAAALLLLDEPFSELDATAETVLLKHCQSLAAAGKMVLLITHSPQGLVYCNKTIQLHDTH
jgi:ABC-type multidrug transport system fused ATPase/permease subunit